MSEDNNDRTQTPPALIPPPDRRSDTDAVAPSPDVVQPEQPVDHDVDSTQSEIAAEQAEASLDARGDSAAHSSADNHEPAAHESVAHEPSAHESDAQEQQGAYESAARNRNGEADDNRSTTAHDNDTNAGLTVIPAGAAATGAAGRPAEEAHPSNQQRAFTSPPVAPKKKGNRVFGALIALVSSVVFLIVFAIVAAIVISVGAPGQSVVGNLTAFLTSPVFYVPAIFFAVAFVLVVLLANRANWWAYIIGSLFVAAVVYFGTIGVGLLISNVVVMTPAEAAAEFARSASNPFVIAGALVAREVAMWSGAAIAARGRRMKVRNRSSREEYERAAAEHRAEYERGFTPA